MLVVVQAICHSFIGGGHVLFQYAFAVALVLLHVAAIRSAGLIYRDIGRAIAENGHDSVTRRAVTSRAAKVRLLLLAAATPFPSATALTLPPHDSVRQLVEACSAPDAAPAPRGFDEKLGRVLDLLATTERRERALMASARGRG